MYPSHKPFPNTGFQITTEETPPDDPPGNKLDLSELLKSGEFRKTQGNLQTKPGFGLEKENPGPTWGPGFSNGVPTAPIRAEL